MPVSRPGLLATLALGLLAGCTPPVADPRAHGAVVLPSDAIPGFGEPMRTAVNNTAHALNMPAALAGRPADAARAIAQYEYLAAELPYLPRGRSFNPLVGLSLAEGLAELRPAAGIAPDAPSQPVVVALFAAARAIEAGDQAAAERLLSAPVFPAGGAATLQRLASLPALPRSGSAALAAATELARQDARGNYR